MKLKYKLVIFVLLLLVFSSTVKSTYARYVSEASGTATYDIAEWKVQVNNTDITSSSSNTVSITPVIDSNTNVASGKVAPGSTGYFDIAIDPSHVDVSYTMNISASFNNVISDMKFIKYGISSGTSYNSSSATITNVNAATSTISKNYTVSSTAYTPYVIRVFFTWDDTNGSMTDSQDTTVGLNAANGTTTTGNINVTLSFNQYTG